MGVIYKLDNVELTQGSTVTLPDTLTNTVTAEPDYGYEFPEDAVDSWEFIWMG